MRWVLQAIVFLSIAVAQPAWAQGYDPDYQGTYSIIARDPETGELGMGVQSKAFAVGYRTWGAKGGLGIIAHQAATNPMYGAIGLELLAAGIPPQDALDMMVRSDDGRDRRQVAILDARGESAAYTGAGASDWKGHHCGDDYCAQGNTLTGPEVVQAMARSFEGSDGPLAERLLAALDAAQEAGGDLRGMQSAALLVVRSMARGDFSDVAVDLRVNDHRTPLAELRRLLNLFRSGEMLREISDMLERNDIEGAMRTATEARDLSPENDNAWVALANVHLRSGQRRQALDALEKGIELNPGNKRRLPRNSDFESLYDDPEFRRLISQ